MDIEPQNSGATKPASRLNPINLLPLLRYVRTTRLEDETRARSNRHIQMALEEEKRIGMRIAIWARTVGLVIVAILLVFLNPRLEVLYYEALLAGFIILGVLQLRMARVGQSRAELGLIFADFILLTFVLLAPNPFVQENWPGAIQTRFDGFDYFYILLAAGTLAYSWRTILSYGGWVAIAWMSGIAAIHFLGKVIPELGDKISAVLADSPRLFELIDPNSVNFPLRIQEVVIFMIASAILALKGWRSNQLLMHQAALASERANLSRYFPPNLVDELAQKTKPVGEVRSQEIAVLFADIVGFTHFAENHEPTEVVAVLRRFHALLENAVFSNGGTLDKFLGDGVMASFGTPNPRPEDAANALQCGKDMLVAMENWNAERREMQLPEIRLSVGIHYGAAILGDIGSERRLEFATLGDTVNVAARLENATRSLACRLVASDNLLKHTGTARDALCASLEPHPALAIRGRETAIDVWLLR
ncbi:MAG: adenylate/guanylate cyclase domain-containing protein [Nitratireductor sp.]|nr:adenylate/guanylate cyclase domain-containing protein [Nitratireductor sp.]